MTHTHTHTVRELATFHGEMYALKASNLKQFNQIVVQLKEARLANGSIFEEYNTKLVACRLRVVNAMKEIDTDKIPQEFLEMFLKYTADPYTCFKKQFEPKEPVAIITHGDYLRNNIAYKFNVRYFDIRLILGKMKMIQFIYRKMMSQQTS